MRPLICRSKSRFMNSFFGVMTSLLAGFFSNNQSLTRWNTSTCTALVPKSGRHLFNTWLYSVIESWGHTSFLKLRMLKKRDRDINEILWIYEFFSSFTLANWWWSTLLFASLIRKCAALYFLLWSTIFYSIFMRLLCAVVVTKKWFARFHKTLFFTWKILMTSQLKNDLLFTCNFAEIIF